MKVAKLILCIMSAMSLGIACTQEQKREHAPETREFHAVTVEIAGTKFWIPSTFIVNKGDTVKLHLVAKVPGPNNVHGFAVDAYKIQAVADEKGTTVEFVADKAGIFPVRCQLHPPHIGGQLVVME
jgi:nitrosocyanin